MKVIKPVTFTAAMLTSTNATETVAAWNSATTYAKDQEVDYANSIYVSLQPSNLNKQPDLTANAAWWIRKSSNNKYSMFDEFVNTQTTRNSSLQVKFTPGTIINSLALFNLTGATSLNVLITDGPTGPVYYDKTVNLDDTSIIDWYMYFFEPYDVLSEVVLDGIPPYSSGVVTLTLTGGSGAVGVGNCVFGNMYTIGLTQYGASAGIRDYSAKEANQFGITSLVRRAFSKRMDSTMFVPTENIRVVRKLLEDLRATPAVWLGTDSSDYDSLNVYGYYRDFNIEITYPSYSLCRLEIEGLI
jgi:hypothetical protein